MPFPLIPSPLSLMEKGEGSLSFWEGQGEGGKLDSKLLLLPLIRLSATFSHKDKG